MGAHNQKRHSKTDSVTWEAPAHVRESVHGDFLDRMYIRTHASGWADFVELELENWPNVPNEIRQQLTKGIHLVRRLYLHSYALDDALAAEARACRAAMGSAADRAARIMELELEIARLQNVPMRYWCHICEESTPSTSTGHCAKCGSERINPGNPKT
jgi:hypothetical protein